MNDLNITRDMRLQLEECAEYYGYTIDIEDTLFTLDLETYRYNDINKSMENIRVLIEQIWFVRKCGANGFVMLGKVSNPDVGEVRGMDIQVDVKDNSVISKIEKLLCRELADRIEYASCYLFENECCKQNGCLYSNEYLKEILEKTKQVYGYDDVRGNAQEGKILFSLYDYFVNEKVFDEGSKGRVKKYSFLFDVWKIVDGVRHESYVKGWDFAGTLAKEKYQYIKRCIEAYNNKIVS